MTLPTPLNAEALAASLGCEIAALRRAAAQLGVSLSESISPEVARLLAEAIGELRSDDRSDVPRTIDGLATEPVRPTMDTLYVRSVPATRESHDPPRTTVESGHLAMAPGGKGRVRLPSALAKRYAWIRDLNSGEQADVQLVTDRESGRRMVAKGYRQAAPRFEEIRARLPFLHHPHLAKIVSLEPYGDEWWEIQDYVEHGTLTDLARSEQWRPEMVADVVRQLAAAINHLHAAKLIHRDVKPANVFIRSMPPDLHVVLGDLGVAKFVDASRDFGTMAGSWPYVPPEFGERGETSPAFDWWSLGMVALELATGSHPFRKPDGTWLSEGEMQRRRKQELVPVPDTVDRRVKALCEGLLNWNPEHRWAGTQINAWLAGEDPPVNRAAPPGASQPDRPSTVLEGKTYTSLEEIATAVSRDHRTGYRILVARKNRSPNFNALRAYFVINDRKDLVNALDQFPIEDDNALDDSLARCIALMSPTARAAYRSRDVSESGLRALVAEAATNPDTRQLLGDLATTGILSIYSSAARPDCSRLAQIESTWAADLKQFDDLAPRSEQRRAATVIMLGAEVDPEYAELLAAIAAAVASDQLANESAWFRHLASSGQNRRAGQVALILLAESAREEARAARARAEAQAARRRRLEQEADDILNDLDGPVSRYRVAFEIERAAVESFNAIFGHPEALAPVPTQGSPSARLMALVTLLPKAAAHLNNLADQASTAAGRQRAETERQMVALQVAAPPLPEVPVRPQRPAPDSTAESYQTLRTLMVPSVVLGLLACFCGLFNPLHFKTNGPMWIELVVVIASAIVLAMWNTARSNGGPESVERAEWKSNQYAAVLSKYEKAMEEYQRLAEARYRAETRRRVQLASAQERRAREGRAADALDAIARRSRVAAADLMDDTMTQRLHSIVHRLQTT